jgi:GAF domain-containing protein
VFELKPVDVTDKKTMYGTLREELQALLQGEGDLIANAANFSSLLFHTLPDVNWAGVYLLKQGELVLGPFQGKPACVRIAIGRGVCGAAAAQRTSLVVPDVDAFPGHIACDSASRSELVVPIVKGDRLIGVLDLDSPSTGRFDDVDREGCESLVAIFVAASVA